MGAVLCASCVAQVIWIQNPICERCGRVVGRQGWLCWACQQQPPLLAQMRGAAYFTGPMRPAIHGLKYRQGFALADPLADLMVQAWPRWQMPVDVVLPIALHADRQRERGYNQAELLATRFAAGVGLPCDTLALVRQRHTTPQVQLSGPERRRNLHQAFVADGARVGGRRVLLVDDVCTTGSTLGAAAEALLQAGATSVFAYCLTRAHSEREHTV